MKMYAEAINIRFNTDAIKLSGEQVGLNSVLDTKPRAKLRQKNLHLSQLILLLTLNLPKVDLFFMYNLRKQEETLIESESGEIVRWSPISRVIVVRPQSRTQSPRAFWARVVRDWIRDW